MAEDNFDKRGDTGDGDDFDESSDSEDDSDADDSDGSGGEQNGLLRFVENMDRDVSPISGDIHLVLFSFDYKPSSADRAAGPGEGRILKMNEKIRLGA